MLPRQILGALPAGSDNFLYNVPSLCTLNITENENVPVCKPNISRDVDETVNVALTFSLLRTLVSGEAGGRENEERRGRRVEGKQKG